MHFGVGTAAWAGRKPAAGYLPDVCNVFSSLYPPTIRDAVAN